MKVLCGAYPAYSHAVTVLKLALALRSAGHTCGVMSSGEALDRLVERHDLPVVGDRQRARAADPFKSAAVEAILDAYQPDVTICDWSDELWWALQSWRPQCRVSVLRCALLMGHVQRNPLLPAPYPFDHPPLVKRANARLRELGLAAVADLREVFAGDLIVIPSVPAVDPLPDAARDCYRDTTVVYTGPLLLAAGPAVSESLVDWIEARHREGSPVLLVTLGTIWGGTVYRGLTECLARTDFAVIVVVPFEYLRCWLEERCGPRVRVSGMTDLARLVDLADVVLHHGGHGTLLTVLRAGKPSVVISSGSAETDDNAQRLEALGCGRYLDHAFFRNGFDSHALNDAIRSVRLDGRIQQRVGAMADVIREYETTGPEAFAQALSGHVH